MNLLIPALILLVVTVVLLVMGMYRSSSTYAMGERLEQLKAGDQTAQEELSKPFAQRVIFPLGGLVARMFRGSTPAEMSEQTRKKLIMAGLHPRVSPSQLLGLCWFSAGGCVVLMFVLLITLGVASRDNPWNDPFTIAYLLLALVGGYLVPQFILSRKVKTRQEEILLTLPYSIDILSISVEAGMGFDAGVGYTMKKIKGPLADEFAKTLNEIRLGKPRLDALEDLGNRTGVEELKTFITAVVHASRLGGSITNTLRIQADAMRVRQRQRAQEQAMKAPVKMVIPLVFFIFPALFVVILGPALMSILNNINK